MKSNIKSLKKLIESEWLWSSDLILFKKQLQSISNDAKEDKICPICGEQSLFFIPFNGRSHAQCYSCGSLERHRSLYLYINKYTQIFNKENKLLHFAPEDVLYNLFNNSKNISYITADIEKKDNIKTKIDMCNIPYNNNSFDYIIANHVLEHIYDDIKAMKELYRTIKPYTNEKKCKVIITVPLFRNLEKTFENKNYNTDELRLKHFGQKDHVRKYGLDIIDRLKSVGFEVNEIRNAEIYSEEEMALYGLSRYESIFECIKK